MIHEAPVIGALSTKLRIFGLRRGGFGAISRVRSPSCDRLPLGKCRLVIARDRAAPAARRQFRTGIGALEGPGGHFGRSAELW